MIRFQFSKGDKIDFKGQTKEEFLTTIQHRLSKLQSSFTSETEFFEVHAPSSSLNQSNTISI